jgi:tetratricopeptide (TPR) repeat protein
MSFGIAWGEWPTFEEADRFWAQRDDPEVVLALHQILNREWEAPLGREVDLRARTKLVEAHLNLWEPELALEQVNLAEWVVGSRVSDRVLLGRLRAIANHRLGEPDRARVAVDKALGLAKRESVSLLALSGNFELSQGRANAATAALLKALAITVLSSEISPADRVRLRLLSARIDYWSGRYASAESALRRIVERNPRTEHRALVHMALGQVLLAAPGDRISDAIREFEAALKLYGRGPAAHPGGVWSRAQLAWAYASRDRLPEARAQIRAAKARAWSSLQWVHPVWADVMLAQAWILARSGKAGEATVRVARAIDLESGYQADSAPSIVRARLALSQIQLADGNKKEALRLAESCVQAIERDFGKDAGALWLPLRHVADAMRDLGRDEDAARARERMQAAIRQAKR